MSFLMSPVDALAPFRCVGRPIGWPYSAYDGVDVDVVVLYSQCTVWVGSQVARETGFRND